MLEAIREHAQGKIAKVILALITIPFALWGVESYIQNTGGGPVAAKVDDHEISQQEFTNALKEQQDKMRASQGKNFDPAMMDQPEIRKSILDALINRRLILADAAREGVSVSNAQLARYIASADIFHENGQYSQARYETWLRQQNMTESMLAQQLRQDLLLQTAREGVIRAAMLPGSVSDGLTHMMEQKREISHAAIPVEQFLSQTRSDPAAVKDYYEKHQDEFRVPEQARLEYVVLSIESLLPLMEASESEILSYYQENASQFGLPEERQASHILIGLPAGAGAAEVKAAGDKANSIWQEAKQNPAGFAQLAKQHSQDPGSAEKGGDLGFFGRGAMVKPFEDTVFKMAEGEIAAPVRSDYGFHIIRLVAIKPGKGRALAEVRDEIIGELKKQKAGKKFTENAENFSNLVYEQSDSLTPAASELGLKVEQGVWVSRMGSDMPLLNNPKLLDAVFGDEVLKNKRNTEAIEVAPNTLVAARVQEYRPASVKPLEEVSTALSQRLQRQQASGLAVKSGKEMLASLQQGKTQGSLNWGQPQVASRGDASAGTDPAVLKAAFRIAAGKLPGYAGFENAQGGFTLVRVSRVMEAEGIDEAKKQAYAQRFTGMLEQEYAIAYLTSLKQKAKIDIRREALEKSER